MKQIRFFRWMAVLAIGIIVAPLFFQIRTAAAASAALYLSPSTKSVTEGDTFTVGLYVSSDVNMNAAEATITFPVDLLTLTGVSRSGIFSSWAAGPSYSNTSGRLTFTGGLPNPGYKGSAGHILTMTFKAKTPGKASVRVTNGSVAKNDQYGTELLNSQGSGTYTIIQSAPPPTPTPTPTPTPKTSAPVVTDPVHADQSKWSNARNVAAAWSAGSNVRGYSVVFDSSPTTPSPQVVNSNAASFSKTDVADGTSYLHVAAKYDTGWSTTTTFKYQIDATPPEKFAITIIGDPQLNFTTTDATSGVDHYELSLDNGAFVTVTSPYQTPDLDPGTHTVTVKAFDHAGNSTEASTTFEVAGYAQPVVIDLTPVMRGGQPMIVRGFSNAQDSIRLTIGGDDYGPYKVSDHLDLNPPSPAPAGKVAWRLELTPPLPNGEYSITFTAIGPDGRVSASTPPVKFRIESPGIRLIGHVFAVPLVINVLMLLVLLVLLLAGFYAWKFYRLRRRVSTTLPGTKKRAESEKSASHEHS